MAVVPRKRLDISFRDMSLALRDCATTPDSAAEGLERGLETLWGPHDALACLSVRTGFDLLLRALALPAGAEVLMTAITIADMVAIAEHHALRVVPVDVPFASLAVTPQALDAARTPATRVLVVAHVFGAYTPLDPAVTDWCARHDVLLVEDCAEAFTGVQFRGNDQADASLFSFGTIKTSTAFGGALVRVRCPELLLRMRRLHDRYARRPRSLFAKRVAKYALVHALSSPTAFGAAVRACRRVGLDHDDVITAAVRGFAGQELIPAIRHRPSAPLLALLARRLARVDAAGLARRVARGRLAMRRLRGAPGVLVPGSQAAEHSFWLFPVVVAHPDAVVDALLRVGFDATRGATQLGSADLYVSSSGSTPVEARFLMDSVVYLPLGPDVPKSEVHRLIDKLLRETEGEPVVLPGSRL